MKNIQYTFTLLCLFLFNNLAANAAVDDGGEIVIPIPYDSASSKYAYIDVVKVDYSSTELYNNSKQWLVNKFLNEEYGLDNPGKKLVKEGSFDIITTMGVGMGITAQFNYTINFNIVLEFKEGRYRYSIYNIVMSQNAEGTTAEQSIENFIVSGDQMGIGRKKMNKFIESTCEIMHKEFNLFIDEMTDSIKNRSSDVKDEW